MNFGSPFAEIYHRIPVLLGNARFWIGNNTFGIDEIAVRLHYQLEHASFRAALQNFDRR